MSICLLLSALCASDLVSDSDADSDSDSVWSILVWSGHFMCPLRRPLAFISIKCKSQRGFFLLQLLLLSLALLHGRPPCYCCLFLSVGGRGSISKVGKCFSRVAAFCFPEGEAAFRLQPTKNTDFAFSYSYIFYERCRGLNCSRSCVEFFFKKCGSSALFLYSLYVTILKLLENQFNNQNKPKKSP